MPLFGLVPCRFSASQSHVEYWFLSLFYVAIITSEGGSLTLDWGYGAIECVHGPLLGFHVVDPFLVLIYLGNDQVFLLFNHVQQVLFMVIQGLFLPGYNFIQPHLFLLLLLFEGLQVDEFLLLKSVYLLLPHFSLLC